MDNKNTIFRNIPQVEKLLQIEEISRFIPIIGHGAVVKIIRRVICAFRERLENGPDIKIEKLIPSIVKNCTIKKLHKLQRVINGTGVIIHTNLGRAPINDTMFEGMNDALSGYCNLEFHLPTERRGKRGGYAEELICNLTSAEDALIVNNNASSVFLILNQFAKGKETIVSRGELIQIGGGFRIPDIMRQTGAKLVEVGTTNITELDDFRNAITDNTSMILSVHQSNYKINGFTRSPSLKELSSLKNDSIIFVRDLGSGNLVNEKQLSQPFEPTINSELSQGADLVCFSGDKLLGSCQAGIIIGRKDLIARLRVNPLLRMIRVDKITYFILQETLIRYENRQLNDILLWDIIHQDKRDISNKINRLMRNIKNPVKKDFIEKVSTKSTFGGGALPTVEVDSFGIQIEIPGSGPDKLFTMFIAAEIPIIGSIVDNKYTLDFMTIFNKDIPLIAAVIDKIIKAASDAE